MPNKITQYCRKGHRKTGRRSRRLVDGKLHSYLFCLICRKEAKKKYYNKHTAKAKKSAAITKLKIKYGISWAEYNALLYFQNNKCAICGKPSNGKPLFVDHKDGEIRGLLCSRCNLAIGLLKDSPENADMAANYLRGNNIVKLLKRDGMKITIHNTTKTVDVNGIISRIWEGETESGIKVHCYITRIAVDEKEPRIGEFENELKSVSGPSPAVQAISLRQIL